MAQPKRLGDLLLEHGFITSDQLKRALEKQAESGKKLGDILIEEGYITEQQKMEVLEFQLGIPHLYLHRQQFDPKAISLVPDTLARKHVVMPIRIKDGKLLVAMADPLDYYALDDLRLITGFPIEPAIASKEEIVQTIQRFYSIRESTDAIVSELPQEMEDINPVNEDSPVVRLVHQIITAAVMQGASDIHIDPQENHVKIRFRIDGVLRTVKEFPAHLHSMILTRLKILGHLNIAERRIPQDGRFELEVEQRKIDLRLSTLPTVFGEKCVIRILDMKNIRRDIEQLDFSAPNLRKFLQILHAPYGMILITGPTGSGKSTTLYSALSRLNSDNVNIITIEDPVEYQLEGINQVQVNPQIGLTFASGLRSILRQDPNIIMVGEIRDLETAEIAIRAALTGHLVLSTLHTNNATGALTRLIDMGIEPFLVSSVIVGIVAQRLVRKICAHCRTTFPPTEEERILLSQFQIDPPHLYRGTGCVHCHQSGYSGRIAIQEVLLLDDRLREMVVMRKGEQAYKAHADATGFSTMLRDGIEKAVKGVTTLQEVISVTIEQMKMT